MALRDIISIDEELCDGCGDCVPSCVEGALRIIDGKARVVADVLCDGMGACVGECPTGALTVVRRDAQEFDEAAVAVAVGHAHSHVAAGAAPALRRVPSRPLAAVHTSQPAMGGCPGSRVQTFDQPAAPEPAAARSRMIPLQDRTPPAAAPSPSPSPSASGSRLRQWPVQLHLLPPTAPFFAGKELLLAADCVPVALGDFHTAFLDGRALAIACPKLDQQLDAYVQKLTAMVDHGGITSLAVAVMEVPCCTGLVRVAEQALAAASRSVPLRLIRIGVRGDVLSDNLA
ncbi:MAG: 4Fe-4S dicluster domain-containing protein [Acidobacteriota bacterium]